MQESDLISFQLRRQIINLAKDFLFLLEDRYKIINEQDKTLKELGIESNQNIEYSKDRARILSKSNDCIRELTSLIEAFDIKLQKSDINEGN